jgi:5'-3' exonuclease
MLVIEMSFEKSQLRYNDGKRFKWDKPADVYSPFYTSGEGDTKFDRTNGNEVLYFINHLFRDFEEEPTLSHYLKAEEMIVFDLPQWKKSHKNAAEWIFKNWDNKERILL